MNSRRFDRLTQRLNRAPNRHRFGAMLASLGLGARLGVDAHTEPRKIKPKGY